MDATWGIGCDSSGHVTPRRNDCNDFPPKAPPAPAPSRPEPCATRLAAAARRGPARSRQRQGRAGVADQDEDLPGQGPGSVVVPNQSGDSLDDVAGQAQRQQRSFSAVYTSNPYRANSILTKYSANRPTWC